MSNDIVLTPILFVNNTTAATTSQWFPAASRYSGVQNRSFFGIRSDKDSQIIVQSKISVPQYDRNGRSTTAVEVTATVTTFTSAAGTNINCMIEQPATHFRVIKANASGAATIVGLV